ncbi:hypothetical protein SAMN05216226_1311 [Halovenus aranensis]|uniref:Uncharacterized protein n=1 Tax=Halovenus aranensis TaxID=890420 RepID=A0A1G8ZQ52_9EURY|nr:hypothetical protein SAMN05216226_1311 [Halovenus aranensis]
MELRLTPPEIPDIVGELQSQNLLAIGGPKVGKTHHWSKLDDTKVISRLDEVLDDISESKIVVDDFYNVYREYQSSSNAEACAQFRQIINKEEGVCFSTRPYDIEYLLTNTSLSEELFDDYKICFIEYYEADTLVECNKIDNAVDEKYIKDNLDRLHYTYNFSTLDLPKYQTYLPYLLMEFAKLEGDSAVFWSDLSDTAKEKISYTSFSGLTNAIKKKIPENTAREVLEKANLLDAGLAVGAINIGATYLAIPIVLRSLLTDDTQENIQDEFGDLLSRNVLPHTQAKIEENADIPPRQLESLSQIADPIFIDSLESTIEDHEIYIQEIRSELKDFEDQFKKFREANESMNSGLRPISRFISDQFERAIGDTYDLISNEKQRKKDVFQEELGWESEKSTNKLDALDDLFLHSDELEQVLNKCPELDVVVVTGPMGVGKTRFLYEMGVELENRGYTTGACNLQAKNFIKPRAESLSSDSENVALFYQFNGWENHATGEFRELFAQEIESEYDLLVIECGQSQFTEFSKAWKQTSQTGNDHLATKVKPDKIVTLSSSNVDQLIRVLDIEDDSVIQTIVDESGGNPLVAFEASVLWHSSSDPEISGIGKRGVIRRRLRQVIEHFESQTSHSVSPSEIMKSLAVVRQVSDIDELLEISGMDQKGATRDLIRGSMNGYVNQSGSQIELKPTLYAQILFWDIWFESSVTGDLHLQSKRNDYLDRISGSYPQGFIGCAENLGVIWQEPLQRETTGGEVADVIIKSALEILDKAQNGKYFPDCLLALASSGITLRRENLESIEPLKWANDNVSDENISSSGPKLQWAFVQLATNFVIDDSNNEFRQLLEMGEQTIAGISDNTSNKESRYLIPYFAQVSAFIVDDFEPDEASVYLDIIEEKAKEVAKEVEVRQHDRLLWNFYSLIIWPFAMSGEQPQEVTAWVKDIEKRAQNCQIKIEKRGTFVLRVFAGAIGRLGPEEPNKLEQWVRFLENRASRIDCERGLISDHELSLIREFYSIVIGVLSEYYRPSKMETWVDFALERLAQLIESSTSEMNKLVLRLTCQEMEYVLLFTDTFVERSTKEGPGDWFEFILEKSKEVMGTNDFSDRFYQEVLIFTLARIAEKRLDTEIDQWREEYLVRFSEYNSEPKSEIRAKALGQSLSAIAQFSEPDEVDDWVDAYFSGMVPEGDEYTDQIDNFCAIAFYEMLYTVDSESFRPWANRLSDVYIRKKPHPDSAPASRTDVAIYNFYPDALSRCMGNLPFNDQISSKVSIIFELAKDQPGATHTLMYGFSILLTIDRTSCDSDSQEWMDYIVSKGRNELQPEKFGRSLHILLRGLSRGLWSNLGDEQLETWAIKLLSYENLYHDILEFFDARMNAEKGSVHLVKYTLRFVRFGQQSEYPGVIYTELQARIEEIQDEFPEAYEVLNGTPSASPTRLLNNSGELRDGII